MLNSLQVLICTHNRRRLLERTIASLNAADRPPDCELGLLVIANACTDDTEAYLDAYSDRPGPAEAGKEDALPLTWFSEPNPGKANALNRALREITGDLIAFVDDDHRVDGGYLRAVVAAAERWQDAGIFCGRIIPDWDGSEPRWVHDRGRYRVYPLPVPRFELGDEPAPVREDGPIPGGGNLAVRAAAWRQVGEFRPDFGPVGHDLGGAEDSEWVSRARADGFVAQYVPSILQYHYVDNERLQLGYLMRKAYQRSSAMVRLGEDGGTRIPAYVWRKIASYAAAAVFSISVARRRWYLVRLAAAAGEVKGFARRYRDARSPRPYRDRR